jgi:SAM-dependent methyltransferase
MKRHVSFGQRSYSRAFPADEAGDERGGEKTREQLGRRIRAIYHRFEKQVPVLRLRLGVGTAAFADNWFERGLPVHRNYLEEFLTLHAVDIRGHCLEFQEDTYMTRLGGDRVTRLDILHKAGDKESRHATLIADLTKPNALPGNTFDCIVCTYVLHLVYDFQRFTSELHRLLRPGGVLLIAVPHITICYPQYGEFWRFTVEGLRRVLAQEFGTQGVEVVSYGNSLTAAGELRGLAAFDFTKAELAFHDDRYGLLLGARGVKSVSK